MQNGIIGKIEGGRNGGQCVNSFAPYVAIQEVADRFPSSIVLLLSLFLLLPMPNFLQREFSSSFFFLFLFLRKINRQNARMKIKRSTRFFKYFQKNFLRKKKKRENLCDERTKRQLEILLIRRGKFKRIEENRFIQQTQVRFLFKPS